MANFLGTSTDIGPGNEEFKDVMDAYYKEFMDTLQKVWKGRHVNTHRGCSSVVERSLRM